MATRTALVSSSTAWGISMKLVRSVVLAVALTGGALTAGVAAAPDKQAPAEVTPGEARAWVALFDKVVDAVVVHKDDCAQMAGSLHALIDANQDAITIARDAKARGKKLPTSAQQRMLDGMRRMVAALDKCGRDDKVAAAFKRIDLGGRR